MTRKEILTQKEHFSFSDLEEIVRILRAPDGCPWDRVQGHRDLRNNLVEEAYEACEGIDDEQSDILCEELGDLLLQVVFHAHIANDRNEFSMQELLDGICRKMIRRHPHIFSSDEKMPDWEEIKRREKGAKTLAEQLAGISKALPSLIRAQKIIKKCTPVPAFLPEKQGEEDEIGASLFQICKICNEKGYDAEELLGHYLDKFMLNCTKSDT